MGSVADDQFVPTHVLSALRLGSSKLWKGLESEWAHRMTSGS